MSRIKSGAVWHLRNQNTPGTPDVPVFTYGGSTHKPITGDWNADGIDTVGVTYTVGCCISWALINYNVSGSPSYPVFSYGGSAAKRLAGNWDGLY